VFQSKYIILKQRKWTCYFCFLPRCVWDKFINRKTVWQNYGFEFIIAVVRQTGYK